MATRKKAKAKRVKKPAKKQTARKKVRAVGKTAAKKRPAPAKKKPAPAKKKPAPPKKKPAPKRKVSKPARRAARRPSKPPTSAKPAVAPAPAPAPLAGEERVGVVTHYYGHLSVAAVMIDTVALRVGDTIHVVGHTSDFRQRVESMQVEHESVAEALPDQEVGLKVTEHAREHDVVYKVPA